MCTFGSLDSIEWTLYILQCKYYGVNIIMWNCSVDIIGLILTCE